MKVITGNALDDGRVIYLGVDGQWKDYIEDAHLIADEEGEAELANAQKRMTQVADLYLIEVTQDKKTAGREALREAIRSAGPTMRTDLGKQAEK